MLEPLHGLLSPCKCKCVSHISSPTRRKTSPYYKVSSPKLLPRHQHQHISDNIGTDPVSMSFSVSIIAPWHVLLPEAVGGNWHLRGSWKWIRPEAGNLPFQVCCYVVCESRHFGKQLSVLSCLVVRWCTGCIFLLTMRCYSQQKTRTFQHY